MISIYVIIFLGIVGGITEFLPISSTAHIILIGKIFSIPPQQIKVITTTLQIVLLPIVMWHYRSIIWESIKVIIYKQKMPQLLLKLIITCLPLVGLTLIIKNPSFNIYFIALNIVLGGIAIIFTEKFTRTFNTFNLREISYRKALFIGCFNALGIFPGVSRLGMTLIGGRIVGLDRSTSVDFSFLLYMPMCIAGISYDLLSYHSLNLTYMRNENWLFLLLGLVTALLAAGFSINFLLSYLKNRSMIIFGYYRIFIGIILAITLYFKHLNF